MTIKKRNFFALSLITTSLILSSCTIVPNNELEKSATKPTLYPSPIKVGKAQVEQSAGKMTLHNDVVSISYGEERGRLIALTVENLGTGEKVEMPESAFALTFADGRKGLMSSEMRLTSPLKEVKLLPELNSTQASKQFAGKALEAELIDTTGNIKVLWRAELRDQSAYAIVSVNVSALTNDIPLKELFLFHHSVKGSKMVGEVQGSVMTSNSLFFAYEHPMADNSNGAGHEIITYSKSDVSDASGYSKTFDLGKFVNHAGSYKFEFRHHKGESALHISNVVLLEDGRVVSSDKHRGWSDNDEDVNQFYTVELAKFNAKAKYQISVSLQTQDGTDSTGVINAHRYPSGDLIRCSYVRNAAIKAGESYSGSLVIGSFPKKQLRRAFLCYLEKERVQPYRSFLNYNSWYDIGYFSKYNEADALGIIKAFGEELVRKRGVKMDSLLFDDGWDNDETLWKFHSGFPNGFSRLASLSKKYGMAPGVWLSPWGGYGAPRTNRVNAGRKNGFEIYENEDAPDESVFKMSGPKYYERFSSICKEMVSKYNVNHFKFDGIGGNSGNGADNFAPDFEAALKLISEIRDLRPDTYINLTTGTWPSPFWLKTCDSIWRGGVDHDFAGVGSKRQQWLTYRDGVVYNQVVKRAPLYPITSLMVHGAILAKKAKGLDSATDQDFQDEIRSMFGAGSQLQELYISPELMNERKWDDLAEAAKWARKQAPVLADSHWVGGNPMELEIYGFASWKNNFGTLTLRNPSDKEQSILLILSDVFELPKEAWSEFDFKCPFEIKFVNDKPVLPQRLYAFSTKSFLQLRLTLKPFEVLVFETTPTQ